LPSVRLSQAPAGRSRFCLQHGVADADPTHADLTRLVGCYGGVVQTASPGIILQASNASASDGDRARAACGWPALFADDRFTSRWYVESSARARMGPSAATFSAETHRAARGRSGGKAWKPQRDLGNRG
jgi:hypothetical protein